MTTQFTVKDIEKALRLKEPDGLLAQNKMSPLSRLNRRPEEKPGQARLGGVLMLLFCRDDELHLVLTRRREDLPSHAGQISFPGGRNEVRETLLETALRETHEEVGVQPQTLRVLG